MKCACLYSSLLCESLSFSAAQNLLSCTPPPAMSYTVDHLPYIHPATATCACVCMRARAHSVPVYTGMLCLLMGSECRHDVWQWN